jgi:hypothetical protein
MVAVLALSLELAMLAAVVESAGALATAQQFAEFDIGPAVTVLVLTWCSPPCWCWPRSPSPSPPPACACRVSRRVAQTDAASARPTRYAGVRGRTPLARRPIAAAAAPWIAARPPPPIVASHRPAHA